MIESKQQLYKLRDAIIEEDKEKIAELTGATEEGSGLLWDAIKLALGRTHLKNHTHINNNIFAPKWINTPTRTIRVPVCFADDILRYAHLLDSGITLEEEVAMIKERVLAGEKGYREKDAGKLIKDLVALDVE